MLPTKRNIGRFLPNISSGETDWRLRENDYCTDNYFGALFVAELARIGNDDWTCQRRSTYGKGNVEKLRRGYRTAKVIHWLMPRCRKRPGLVKEGRGAT